MTKPAQFPVADGHVDLIYDLMRRHPGTAVEDLPDSWCSLPQLAAGNVRVIVAAFYCQDACNGPLTASGHLRSLLQYAEDYLQALPVIRAPRELAGCFEGTGAPGALLLLENADPLLEYDPGTLRRRGFRLVGLTHAGRNRIGCGNMVASPSGLTDAGRSLVARLDRLGMAIDTAHLSEPCFREVADSFTGPLVSTHTGIRAFCDTPRNLSDQQARTILSRDGMIGLAVYPGTLTPSGEADIHDYFRQLDWLLQRYGPRGIGIGSDFGGFDTPCRGLEGYAALHRLADLLSDAGYSDQVIRAVFGENWRRFFSGLLSAVQDED
jgi:membrane dipeptidase